MTEGVYAIDTVQAIVRYSPTTSNRTPPPSALKGSHLPLHAGRLTPLCFCVWNSCGRGMPPPLPFIDDTASHPTSVTPKGVTPCSSGMTATGSHGYFYSLRGAQPQGEGFSQKLLPPTSGGRTLPQSGLAASQPPLMRGPRGSCFQGNLLFFLFSSLFTLLFSLKNSPHGGEFFLSYSPLPSVLLFLGRRL